MRRLLPKEQQELQLDRRPIMCKTGSNSFSLSVSPGLDLARSLSSRIIIITC